MSCSICLHKNTNPFQLNCKHSFHKECIEKWLNINNSCPICREPDTRMNIISDKVIELIKEINSLSDFKIKYHGICIKELKCSPQFFKMITCLKTNLSIYKSIRSNGFSADHLASEIGYMFDDINLEFKLLSIN